MNLGQIGLLLLTTSLFFTCAGTGTGRGSGSSDSGNGFTGETIRANRIGTFDGYGFEYWRDGPVTGSMTLGRGGTFRCTWTHTGPTGNILFRRGRKFAEPLRPHTQIGNITVNYTATYSPSSSGVSYLCVYGWTRNPLVEYYIVDSWGSSRPPGAWEVNRTRIGEITVDGGTYDIWTSDRINQPSIDGTNTFKQYWSVRRTPRTSGTISVSEHFKKWQELGMDMTGGLYEVALTVEGYNNSGTAEITQNTLTIN
jgi:endo-1,4-beta-xylanase